MMKGPLKMKYPAILLAVVLLNSGAKAWALGFEDFGNKPLNALNYQNWQGITPLLNLPGRVYHSEVNGNEYFYYRGDTATLNDALRKFVGVKTDIHELLLRPGTGIAHSFDGTTIQFQWDLHLVGGVCRVLPTLVQGEKIWPKSPLIAVYVNGEIDLAKLEIPQGVSVLTLSDLSRRYRKALTSNDKTVRGWGAGELAALDPYDTENLAAIATLLKDKDDWVRSNVALSLARFGKKAESLLPALQGLLSTTDKNLKAAVEKAIKEIQQAKYTTAAEGEHREMLKKISQFRNLRR